LAFVGKDDGVHAVGLRTGGGNKTLRREGLRHNVGVVVVIVAVGTFSQATTHKHPQTPSSSCFNRTRDAQGDAVSFSVESEDILLRHIYEDWAFV
jgi:hypothetical protein